MLYTELASWFHLLTSPASYNDEAEFVRRTLSALDTAPKTILELGSGGGNNAFHLKASFDMTLTNISAGMLNISRELNPECEHLPGDMRIVRLGRTFDAVFIHDAVMYITSLPDLGLVAETAFAHCAPGGAVLTMRTTPAKRSKARPGTAAMTTKAGGCATFRGLTIPIHTTAGTFRHGVPAQGC